MTLRTRMQATASRLINAYGFASVLRRESGEIDPVTGVDGRDTTDTPVSAVAVNIELSQVDGTLVQAEDRMYTLSAAVEPKVGDLLRIGGDGAPFWRVTWVKPFQVQDGDAAYRVLVRG